MKLEREKGFVSWPRNVSALFPKLRKRRETCTEALPNVSSLLCPPRSQVLLCPSAARSGAMRPFATIATPSGYRRKAVRVGLCRHETKRPSSHGARAPPRALPRKIRPRAVAVSSAASLRARSALGARDPPRHAVSYAEGETAVRGRGLLRRELSRRGCEGSPRHAASFVKGETAARGRGLLRRELVQPRSRGSVLPQRELQREPLFCSAVFCR
jgi:hypothetical protein